MTRDELHALRMAERGKTPRKLPPDKHDSPPRKPGRPPGSRNHVTKSDDVAARLGLDKQMVDQVLKEVDLGSYDPIGPRAAQCIVLRLLGLSAMQVASKLSLSIDDVRLYLFEARRRGQLMDVAPLLDSMALPQAVDNIIAGVNEGDKDYTLAVAKGRGAFRAFEKHDTDAHLGLTIDFKGYDPGQSADVVEGSIVGAPVADLPLSRDDDDGRQRPPSRSLPAPGPFIPPGSE